MVDITTELKDIAEEILSGNTSLTEGEANAPKKGAGAAEKAETVPGERQDLGPAVVSPDAKSDPGKETSKKSKKSKDLPTKGKPSDASAKIDKMEEEVEEETKDETTIVAESEDDETVVKKSEVEEAMVEVPLYKAYCPEDEDDEEGEDEEEEEVDEEAILKRISDIDVSEDVDALTKGEDLSEEFKTKTATIFEAAVKTKLRTEISHIIERYESVYSSKLEGSRNEMVSKIDSYLSYVVEEWMKKNEMIAEHKMKAEISESFITGLKALFEQHNITIPSEQFDVLDEAAKKADELENKLNEEIEKNVTLNQKINEHVRHEVLIDVSSDLADTEVEKFVGLVESVEYESEESFREKITTLKESYFPKASSNNETVAAVNNDASDEDVSDSMAAYMSAISKFEKRSK